MKQFMTAYYDNVGLLIIYCDVGGVFTRYRYKNYDLGVIPEANTPEAELKITKAILMSLKENKFLSKQQMKICIERLEKTYREENNSRD